MLTNNFSMPLMCISYACCQSVTIKDFEMFYKFAIIPKK